MAPRSVATCRDRKILLLGCDMGAPLFVAAFLCDDVGQMSYLSNICCFMDAINMMVVSSGGQQPGSILPRFCHAVEKK